MLMYAHSALNGMQTIITRSITTTTQQVEIFEARRFVGGKVGSWVDKVRCSNMYMIEWCETGVHVRVLD